MLDEFPALGRLDFFESALAFMAGYGIKSFLVAQSLNQIEKAYGPNNSILDNCHVYVSFATADERTAKRVSNALGTATEMKAMKNYAGSRLSPWLGHLMFSRSETARPLLTPGEVIPRSAVASVRRLRSRHLLRGGALATRIDTDRFYPLTCCMIFAHLSTIGSTLSALSGGNIGTTRATPISLRRFTRSRSSPSANEVISMPAGSRPACRASSRNFGRTSRISPPGIQPSP
jgi:hypothetical protein